VRLVGVDPAWKPENNGSAVAVGRLTGTTLEVEQIHGALFGLPRIAATILAAEPHGIAIDGPLIIKNQTGQRECEKALSKVYASKRAGCHTSNRTLYPDAAVVTVEPEGWDDMRRSLELGEIVPVGPNPPPTLCDAIQTLRVSPLTFGILSARGARGLAVSEEETAAAVRWAWQEHGLTVEPGAAVSMAALLAGKAEIVPETVVLVSGGNIDPAVHAQLVG